MADIPTDLILEKVSPAPGRIRVISIDGGGIYGLATAVWLRRLCEQNERFLDGTDVRLFAGTSAGALNCLLLAAHEVPRKAVLDGTLERFWWDSGVFSNHNPVAVAASLLGVSGWFSGPEFRTLLRRYFGDQSLGDLHHQVLISTFNWRGPNSQPKLISRASQRKAHWRPKFFDNADAGDEDYRTSVVDVAYGAATPPTLRPMVDGLGDGGSFSGNPTLPAIAHLVRYYRFVPNGLDGVDLEVCTRPSGDSYGSAVELFQHREGLLSRLTVLSIGSGQELPRLGETNVDLGFSFSSAPTNPGAGNFWPTSSFSIDPANEEANQIVKRLVGRWRALRLNPAVLNVPTVTAAIMARNPVYKQWLGQAITHNAAGEASTYAIVNTDDFLRRTVGWDCERATDYACWTPARAISDRASPLAPALATLADKSVYMAWTGIAEELGDTTNLWVSTATSCDSLWSDQRQAQFGRKDEASCSSEAPEFCVGSPALAFAEHSVELDNAHLAHRCLVMAWVTRKGAIVTSIGHREFYMQDNRRRWRVAWTHPSTVPGSDDQPTRASASEGTPGPGLAVHGHEVVLAWSDGDQVHLEVGRVKGTVVDGDAAEREARLAEAGIEWLGHRVLASVGEVDGHPSVEADDEGNFAVVWSPKSEGESCCIHVCRLARTTEGLGAGEWSSPQTVSIDQPSLDDGEPAVSMRGGPALGFIEGHWYLAWRGNDDLIWVAVSEPGDHERWLPPVVLLGRSSTRRPALARVKAPHNDPSNRDWVHGRSPLRLLMSWVGQARRAGDATSDVAERDPADYSNNIWVSSLPFPARKR